MEDFTVFADLICVRVGTLHTFHEEEFDVDLSYRECDFSNDKIHSYIKNYRICDFYKVEVGKTYRFVLQSLENGNGLHFEILGEV